MIYSDKGRFSFCGLLSLGSNVTRRKSLISMGVVYKAHLFISLISFIYHFIPVHPCIGASQ